MWRTIGIVALACALAALLPHGAAAQGCPECEEYTLDIPPPKSGGGSKGGGGGGGSTAPQDTAAPIAPVSPTTVPVEPVTTEPDVVPAPEIEADPDLARERRERRRARREAAAAAALKVADLDARESTPLAYGRASAGDALLGQLGGGGWAMLLVLAGLAGSAALARRRTTSR